MTFRQFKNQKEFIDTLIKDGSAPSCKTSDNSPCENNSKNFFDCKMRCHNTEISLSCDSDKQKICLTKCTPKDKKPKPCPPPNPHPCPPPYLFPPNNTHPCQLNPPPSPHSNYPP